MKEKILSSYGWKLQSNKAKNAAEIFDYIHSLDSQKLADIFNTCERKIQKN